MTMPLFVHGDAREEAMDVYPVAPSQSAVHWVDMTRGDEEEGGDVHQRPVEVEDDTIPMRGEERVVCLCAAVFAACVLITAVFLLLLAADR